MGSSTLASSLFIRPFMQDRIRAVYKDEIAQKEEAISYWMEIDPLASWRRLITEAFDLSNLELATSLQPYAEPNIGMYVTLLKGVAMGFKGFV